MFKYKLHSPDGDDLGEAVYGQMIRPGEEIIAGSNERFRVLDVVRSRRRTSRRSWRCYRLRRSSGCKMAVVTPGGPARAS